MQNKHLIKFNTHSAKFLPSYKQNITSLTLKGIYIKIIINIILIGKIIKSVYPKIIENHIN